MNNPHEQRDLPDCEQCGDQLFPEEADKGLICDKCLHGAPWDEHQFTYPCPECSNETTGDVYGAHCDTCRRSANTAATPAVEHVVIQFLTVRRTSIRKPMADLIRSVRPELGRKRIICILRNMVSRGQLSCIKGHYKIKTTDKRYSRRQGE